MRYRCRCLPILVFSLISAFFIFNSAHAAPEPAEKAEPQIATPVQGIASEDLQKLIDTLKDDTKREEFIKNLSILTESHRQESTQPSLLKEPLSETLGLGTGTRTFLEEYEHFLESHNLSTNLLGKLGFSFFITLFSGVLILLVRQGTQWLGLNLVRLQAPYSGNNNRFKLYVRILRNIGYGLVSLLYFYTLAVLWDISDFSFLQSQSALSLLGVIFNIFFVIVIALSIWEALNSFIEFSMWQATKRNYSRLRTLLPLVHNVLFVCFGVLFTLVLLSEVGIDIIPLLTGAGILGIAIGFGAQTMVKDFLSGFTIIFEDLIQVGDVVKVAGCSGQIERITIRKVQLRGFDGTVYTVPFSEIAVIENLTKDFSYYVYDINVAYDQNPDSVIACLHEIDAEMRLEPEFKDIMLEPLEILGLDKFGGDGYIIKARSKTRPLMQWKVGREFNRRIKYKFDEKGIEIPFSQLTVHIRDRQ